MKHTTLLIVLIAAVQYKCESNETQTQNIDSNMLPPNPVIISSNQNTIGGCQKPHFANQTIGKERFISVNNDTFEEYLKMVDLGIFDGLDKNKELINWVPTEELKKDFPLYLSGYDRQNRPIWVFEMGKHKVMKYALGGKEKQAVVIKYFQYLIFIAFKSMAFKSTKGKPVLQFIAIGDFEGLTPNYVLNPRVLQFVLKMASGLTHFFTKHLFKAVLLNANQIAEIVLNVLRSFVTRYWQKMEIYGTNRAFWVPKLVQTYPNDQLPEKYGGCKGFLPTYVM